MDGVHITQQIESMKADHDQLLDKKPISLENTPNMRVYRRMEDLVMRMQDPKSGVPIKNVKSFITKIPSVFTGQELMNWLMLSLGVEDAAEANHLANIMASHGYFFPIGSRADIFGQAVVGLQRTQIMQYTSPSAQCNTRPA